MIKALLCALMLSGSAQACQTALALTMDVSHSVDPGEFRLQTRGLATALRDPEIIEILVQDRIALTVIQWSGPESQDVSIPWTQMRSKADVAAFADQVDGLPRAFILSNTAVAEAVDFTLSYFRQAPDCHRKVIDVSGDGTPNAGGTTSLMRQKAQRAGVTINGLAIEALGIAVTNFYNRHLITRDGFVVTARGHRDYARAIHQKLLREISRVLF